MAELIITHRQRDYLLKMPYQVIISGRPVGVMRSTAGTAASACRILYRNHPHGELYPRRQEGQDNRHDTLRY